jgi:ankyrin repeat protein
MGEGAEAGLKGLHPLHAAVAEGKGPLTRFLLAQGAEVAAAAGPDSLTPLHVAARTGQGPSFPPHLNLTAASWRTGVPVYMPSNIAASSSVA